MPLITQQITDIYTSKNIAGQLDNLELICKKSLNADEESQVIECIKLVKNRIDLAFHEMSPSDYETEQLSADIFKLKRITDYFLGQVQHNAGRVQTLNSEIDAWADSWKKGKERPDVYKVEDLLPPEDVLSSASLSQLVAYQMRIKALMRDLDAEDQGLLKLYWQAYNRVLVHLQKQTVDCPEPGLGSSITPMTIDLTTPSAATTIFALMNLGDVDIHSGSFSPSACLTLSFMIKSLEEMLAENILPADDKARMAQLLKSYKAGYRILLFEETALKDAQQANSLQAYADAKQRIKTYILKTLKIEKQIILSSGYGSYSGSHAVLLRFSLNERDEVHAELINRGEGVNLHPGESVQGAKKRVMSCMGLEKVALQELEESDFFAVLPEFIIPKNPHNVFAEQETMYNVADFYRVILEKWPTGLSTTAYPQTMRGLQKGPTCTLKACWTPFAEVFSSPLTRYIKLKMRIEALELYLNHGKLSKLSIPDLQWSLRKIYRTLKKLEVQLTTEEEDVRWLKKSVEQQVRLCTLLGAAVQERMHALEKEANETLIEQGRKIEKEVTCTGYFTPTLTKCDEEEGDFEEVSPPFKFPLSAAEACAYSTQFQKNHRLIGEFLENLPLICDSNFWDAQDLQGSFCSNLSKLIDERCNQLSIEGCLRMNAGQAVSLIHSCVGVFYLLQKSGQFKSDLIGYQADRMLGILLQMAPQMKVEDPKHEEKFLEAIKELKKLSAKPVSPCLFLLSPTAYRLESVSCRRREEQDKDPLCRYIIEKTKGNTSPRLWRIKDYFENLKKVDSDLYVLLHLHTQFLRIGLDSNAEVYSEASLQMRYVFDKENIRHIEIENVNILNPEMAFCATLTESLYTWKESEISFVQQLLDPRLPFQQGERSTQNQQVKISRGGYLFEGTYLPSYLVEQLLAITAIPDNLLLQCMHFFSPNQSFYLLRDPRFQALFQGFLLMRTPDGEKNILAVTLQNAHLATQFIDFLRQGIEGCTKECLQVRLFYLFLLAKVISYFSVMKDHYPETLRQTAVKVLSDEMLWVEEQSWDKGQENMINHWWVAIFNLVNRYPKLNRASQRAYEMLCEKHIPYQFEGLLAIQDHFRSGFAKLSGTRTPHRNQLPSWVFHAPDYMKVCEDRAPISKMLRENLFEITTQEQRTFRIKICGNRSLKISQQLLDYEGSKRWFFYTFQRWGTFPFFFEVNCWGSEEEPEEIILTSCNHQPYYLKGGKIRDKQLGLVLVDVNTVAPIALVQRFMDLHKKVIVWKEEATSQIKRIECSELDLSFELSLNPNTHMLEWFSLENPGFKVNLQERVAEIELFSHYLVIQKEKEKRVLIPMYMFKKARATFELADLPSEYQHTPPILSYRLMQTGKLQPPNDVKLLLYLIYLMLHLKQYERARSWIESLEKLHVEWGEKEIGMYTCFYGENRYSFDTNPFALALKTRLHVLASKVLWQKKTSTVWMFWNKYTLDKFINQHIELNYTAYLEKTSSLGEIWLSFQDELLAIQAIAQKQDELQSLIFKAREAQLHQQFLPNGFLCPPKLQITQPKEGQSFLEANRSLSKTSNAGEIQRKMLLHCDNPLPIVLNIRPGDPFILNFLYYYRIAYTAEPKQELKKLEDLLAISHGVDELTQSLMSILIYLIKNRGTLSQDQDLAFAEPDQMQAWCQQAELFERLDEILEKRPMGEEERYLTTKQPAALKDISGLKPKKDIIHLTAKLAQKLDRVERDQESELALSLEDPLKKGHLIAFEQEEQRKRLEEQRNALVDLDKVYSKRGCSSRLSEGIKERLQEIQTLTLPSHYTLPVVVAACQPRLDKDAYQKASEQLDATKKWLARRIDDYTSQVRYLEEQIFKMATPRSEELIGQMRAGLLVPLGVQELTIAYIRKEDDKILKANPELGAKELQELKRLLKCYLVAKTDQQLFLRSQAYLTKAIDTATQTSGWDSIAAKNAASAFAKILTQPRAFDINKDCNFLALEALGNLRLREDQFKMLKTLTEGNTCDIDVEARTGFGKSKIIIPLWAFLNSKPNQLTIVVTTASLIEDQFLSLRELAGQEYGMHIQRIGFDREKAADQSYVIWVKEQFQIAKKEGRVILIDIGSFHALSTLTLKYEAFKYSQQRGDFVIWQQLASLRREFKEALCFIDESAECLGIKQLYEYACGSPKPIEPEKCIIPVSFFQQVVLNPKILCKWGLPFLPDASPTAQELVTEDNYPKLREDLADGVIDYLRVPKVFQSSVKEHLMGARTDRAKIYFDGLLPKQKQLYVYCYKQLERHLKISLLRRYGVRYALNEKRLAIPLKEGALRPNSEFCKLDDLINFTIQGNLYCRYDSESVKNLVQDIQAFEQTQPVHFLEENPAYRALVVIANTLGLSYVGAISSKDYQEIANILNMPENQHLCFGLLEGLILPKITQFPYKISANCYGLARHLGRIHSASGTPNPDLLPKRMQCYQNKSALTENLVSLWKNPDHDIVILNAKGELACLRQLLHERPQGRVLIDIGGLFSNLLPQEVVNTIFAVHSDVKAVTFYDHTGCCMIWEKGAKTPVFRETLMLPEEVIFVYIRQAHVIGSDTPMSQSALGLPTVSHDTSETLFLQGLGRMRGLQTGQTANFVLTTTDAHIIRKKLNITGKITLSHLLLYVQQVEIEQNQKDYLLALKYYLKSLIDYTIWGIHEYSSLRALAFEAVEENFLQEAEEIFQNTDFVDAQTAIARLKERVFGPVRALLEKEPHIAKYFDFEKIEEEFDAFAQPKKLGDKVLISHFSEEEEISETEKEKITENARESEMQREMLAASGFTPSDPLKWDGDYRKAMSGRPLKTLFGIKLYQSPNFGVLERGKVLDQILRKPAYQMILKIEENQVSLLALDLHDMDQAFKVMRSMPEESSVSYSLLANQRILAEEGEAVHRDLSELVLDNQLACISLITKSLSGGGCLSSLEVEWVDKKLRKAPFFEQKKFLDFIEEAVSIWPRQRNLRDQIVKLLNKFSHNKIDFSVSLPPQAKIGKSKEKSDPSVNSDKEALALKFEPSLNSTPPPPAPPKTPPASAPHVEQSTKLPPAAQASDAPLDWRKLRTKEKDIFRQSCIDKLVGEWLNSRKDRRSIHWGYVHDLLKKESDETIYEIASQKNPNEIIDKLAHSLGDKIFRPSPLDLSK